MRLRFTMVESNGTHQAHVWDADTGKGIEGVVSATINYGPGYTTATLVLACFEADIIAENCDVEMASCKRGKEMQ